MNVVPTAKAKRPKNIIPTTKEIEEKLRIRFTDKGVRVEVIEDIYFRVWGIWFVLPKGLISDGASIPKILFFLDRFDKRWIFWAIWHDYAYKAQWIPRSVADAIFKWGVRQNAGLFYAIIFYVAVRTFGWLAWLTNKRNGLVEFDDAVERLNNYICKYYEQRRIAT